MSDENSVTKPRPFRAEFWRYTGEKVEWTREQAALPLEVEIGGGVGWFAVTRAKAAPEVRLISLERTREKSEKGKRRHENHPELTNLRIINADARAYFSSELKPGSVSRVWMLYPNPNPKNASERFFVSSFFEKIIEVMAPGGELVLATNIHEYSQEACEAVKNWPELELTASVQIVDLKSFTPRTHFEKKYLSRGETCYESRFKKQ